LDGLGAAGADPVHLGEFGARAGEADLEALGLAVPVVGFGFGDAGDEIVADLFQPGAGGRIRAQQRAAETAVFVDAGGVVGAATVADGDLAALEVPDELGPFGVGGVWYSSVGRSARRRAMKARWPLITSSG
jgi:hypothetical protein